MRVVLGDKGSPRGNADEQLESPTAKERYGLEPWRCLSEGNTEPAERDHHERLWHGRRVMRSLTRLSSPLLTVYPVFVILG